MYSRIVPVNQIDHDVLLDVVVKFHYANKETKKERMNLVAKLIICKININKSACMHFCGCVYIYIHLYTMFPFICCSKNCFHIRDRKCSAKRH